MKKVLFSMLSFILTLLIFVPLQTAASEDIQFDEYGFRMDLSEKSLKRLSLEDERVSANDKWQNLPSKSSVPLDKEWTINFSGIATHEKIDAIIIERNAQYIPVTITFGNSKEVKVKPSKQFVGNANYTMKVLLENGKKYKMDFKTINDYRNLDIEPNNTHIQAQEMYVNETIQGSLASDDKVDFYKINVPKNGRLDVQVKQLQGNRLSLALYGDRGNDGNTIISTLDKSTATLSPGLQAGEYYIRISTYNGYGDYEVVTKFYPETEENDNATSNYVTSPTLNLNETLTGHIGHYNDQGGQNSSDYYKVVLPEDGHLTVNTKHLGSGSLSFNLYGEHGNDRTSIYDTRNNLSTSVTRGLSAGTYYIRVSSFSSSYGSYEVSTSYVPEEITNDLATSSYVTAPEIQLNKSYDGRIGYMSGYNDGNANDYYKLVIPEEGLLDLEVTQLNGGKVSLYLYGSLGSDKSSISSAYNQQTAHINKKLAPGTYYVRIAQYSGAGGYTFKNTFITE